jgi:hypothetical protein
MPAAAAHAPSPPLRLDPPARVLGAEAYLLCMDRGGGWQVGAWGGFVCALLAANGLAHGLTDQGLILFGCALFLFVWAAWAGRARP